MDLVCLQRLDQVEVFTGIDWKKKHKAPTEFGFALKVSNSLLNPDLIFLWFKLQFVIQISNGFVYKCDDGEQFLQLK